MASLIRWCAQRVAISHVGHGFLQLSTHSSFPWLIVHGLSVAFLVFFAHEVLAVRSGAAALKALLAAAANPQLADREGNTPLALARTRNDAAMVRMLEQVGEGVQRLAPPPGQ